LDNERQIRSARPVSRCLALAAAAVMPILAVIAAGVALAQTAPPQPSLGLQEQPARQGTPPPPNPPAAQPSPSPSENPGLINEMGKLFEKSLSILPPLKTPGETIDDLNARAKDAGEALSRLAKPGSMVSGRVICPVAATGTPDCKSGADKLCQSKGYKEGKSLNTDSAQTCSAKVLIPGRQRKPEDCRTDNYVTTALCQ
jgi:hypothetical protein